MTWLVLFALTASQGWDRSLGKTIPAGSRAGPWWALCLLHPWSQISNRTSWEGAGGGSAQPQGETLEKCVSRAVLGWQRGSASTDRDSWAGHGDGSSVPGLSPVGELLLLPLAQKEILHPTELLSAPLNNSEAETKQRINSSSASSTSQ